MSDILYVDTTNIVNWLQDQSFTSPPPERISTYGLGSLRRYGPPGSGEERVKIKYLDSRAPDLAGEIEVNKSVADLRGYAYDEVLTTMNSLQALANSSDTSLGGIFNQAAEYDVTPKKRGKPESKQEVVDIVTGWLDGVFGAGHSLPRSAAELQIYGGFYSAMQKRSSYTSKVGGATTARRILFVAMLCCKQYDEDLAERVIDSNVANGSNGHYRIADNIIQDIFGVSGEQQEGVRNVLRCLECFHEAQHIDRHLKYLIALQELDVDFEKLRKNYSDPMNRKLMQAGISVWGSDQLSFRHITHPGPDYKKWSDFVVWRRAKALERKIKRYQTE